MNGTFSMIQRCTEQDREGILAYVDGAVDRCLYLYMDLLEFGFDSPEVSVWAEATPARALACVGLVYGKTCHLFSRDRRFDAAAWARHLRAQGVTLACAEGAIVRQLAEALPGKAEYGYEGRLDAPPPADDRTGIRRARAEDFVAIARLLHREAHYDRKADLATVEEQLRTRWARGFARNYVLECGGGIAAHVGTTAEMGRVAVLGAVVTHTAFRSRGFAGRLYHAVCADLLAEGKEVFSFYYDAAGRGVNERMGLMPHCEWGRLFVASEGTR